MSTTALPKRPPERETINGLAIESAQPHCIMQLPDFEVWRCTCALTADSLLRLSPGVKRENPIR